MYLTLLTPTQLHICTTINKMSQLPQKRKEKKKTKEEVIKSLLLGFFCLWSLAIIWNP